MTHWVRVSTLGRPLLQEVVTRCPVRVVILPPLEKHLIPRTGTTDTYLRDAIAWCMSNIGDSMFNYTSAHPQMHSYVQPAKEKINLDGTWAYGVRAFSTFYFSNETDATAFKLVWA